MTQPCLRKQPTILEEHTSLSPPELWESAGQMQTQTPTPRPCCPQASPLEPVHLTRPTEMSQLHSLPSKPALIFMPASLQDLGLDLPAASSGFLWCPWKLDCSSCRPQGELLEYPQHFKQHSASLLFLFLPAAGAGPTCADSGRAGSAP